ncbi:MAG: hybrid sensor histidine kinase/response regulator, partial [Rhizobacter sp.]|nr:hybrid sensor histidine kinase/response regulator [Rhizobacter sp.]
QEELRRSLDTAHKSLRRFLKDTDHLVGADIDVADPGVLRTARQQLHQGVGALELVGLPSGAALLRASETLVQRFIAKPTRLKADGVEAVENASFALLDYLARVLAERPVSPLSLFPQYRTLQEMAGAERVHPADLWPMDWRWLELPADASARPRLPNAATHTEIEQQLLGMMRGKPEAAQRMSDICAGLGAGALAVESATLWRLAAGFFEAQALGLLQPDVFSKRIASRVLAQARGGERGATDMSERLAQDLLFFCAQATSPTSMSHAAPRLEAVRQVYRLNLHAPVDYATTTLGRFDPALIAQARKRVSTAKEAWSAVAGGELHRLSGLAEQFTLVGESIRRLYPAGDVMADSVQRAISQTVQAGATPAPALAMEVATSVLYLEASLEDADFDHPDQAARVRHLASRITSVRQGTAPAPLEGWMEELYRRVSDRQTMGSVVQELRASLSAVEKLIDPYFRDPEQREVLIPVPAQLSSMRGVLSVLGMDHASHAVLHMRDDVDALIVIGNDVPPAKRAATFERLAANLGALGFLIDMLSVQPQLAKSLFAWNAQDGTLSPVMGRNAPATIVAVQTPQARDAAADARLVGQAQSLAGESMRPEVPVHTMARELARLSDDAAAAHEPALAQAALEAQAALLDAQDATDPLEMTAVREQLHQVMVDFSESRSDPIGLDPVGPALTAFPSLPTLPGGLDTAHGALASMASASVPVMSLASAVPSMSPGGAGLGTLDDDPEMREIFLEEAREVLAAAQQSLRELARRPDDLEPFTSLRRAFHTLKGSSRMVGLTDFGDAAWACEQLYNTRQAEQQPADDALLAFTAQALTYFDGWVEGIAAGDVGAHESLAVKTSAAAVSGSATGSAGPVVPAAVVPAFSSSALADLAELGELAQPDAPVVEPARFGSIDADVTFLEPTAGDANFDFDLDLPTDSFHAATEPMPLPDVQPLPEPTSLEPDLLLDFFSNDDEPATLAADAPPVPPADPFEMPDPLRLEKTAPEAVAPADAELSTSNDSPFIDLSFDEPAGIVAEEVVDLSLPLDLAVADMVEAPALDDLDEGADAPVEVIEMTAAEVALPHDLSRESETTSASPHAEVEAEAEPLVELQASSAFDEIDEIDDPATVDGVKQIGSLSIGIPLFNIYLNEADELSRRLCAEVGEWTMDLQQPVAESTIALAHSLAGNSATVGYADLSHLSRLLEHALTRSQALGSTTADEGRLFLDASEEIRRLLHQFAAGFLKAPNVELIERLDAHEVESAQRLEALNAHDDEMPSVFDTERDELVDEVEAPHAVAGPPDSIDTGHEVTTDVAHAAEAAQAASHIDVAEPIASEAPVDSGPTRALVETLVEIDDESAKAAADVAADVPSQAPAEPAPMLSLASLGQVELKAFTALPDDVSHPHAVAAHDHEPLLQGDDDIDAIDAVDVELFPIFEEEAEELLPVLSGKIREWMAQPLDAGFPAACMRTLHTLKGGARLAGAMRLGEMSHRLETAIERLLARGEGSDIVADDIDVLQGRADALVATFEALRSRDAQAYAQAMAAATEASHASLPMLRPMVAPAVPSESSPLIADATPTAAAPIDAGTDVVPDHADAPSPIDWSAFTTGPQVGKPATAHRVPVANASSVRVQGPLLERLVNQAGEVSIARSRIEAEVAQIKSSLGDLTENLERLRQQLRDIELQAETQMTSRLEAAKAASETFDPLESDRFTRFQELTRMMAESVNDVATVQRTLARTIEAAEDDLIAQARLTRSMQDDLLRTRMVEFEGLSDRLYRVVRQAAKETHKQVRLDIVGGSIEVDRGVLDRMTASFEHLLRNCVSHGIELPEARTAAGKDPIGTITILVGQEGNEVGVEIRDDGAGLDLPRIRERGIAHGLLATYATPSDAELANLIFAPGLTTTERVTELAGRGVGMDVVRSDVNAMGGRIETATASGQGTSFKLVLPLTTAVTQVVMLRCGNTTIAVPSTLIEMVRRATPAEVEIGYATGAYVFGERQLPFFWLGALLQMSPRGLETGRTLPVVVIRSAQQRIALHVDEVFGNQEVVVKNLGPQLARLPGLVGITLLASGSPAMIYNPVALATLYGELARAQTLASLQRPSTSEGSHPQAVPMQSHQPLPTEQVKPLVLVVDDSLTVRRVTQRLLVREGYRVTVAKDGLDALEKLAEERPAVILSDIEMPRMDGFDLVRNLRADPALAGLPVIMITSRIATKHRDYATELGVDHYLGKPYSEEELLALIGRYTAGAVMSS